MDMYSQIFERKSFHLFQHTTPIPMEKMDALSEFLTTVKPLHEGIRTAFRIVPEAETSCHRGAEYCILMYSEKKEDYLKNIGYIGQQIDLYCVSQGIGSLWVGMGKPKETEWDGLSYVIMIEIAGVKEDSFRNDMFKAKRKDLAEIWSGEEYNVANIVRFSPSACNSQPWIVESENNVLKIYRYKKPGKVGIMTPEKAYYFNRMDIGIFICILEICLEHEGILFEGKQYPDEIDEEKVLVAEYTIK